MSLGWHVLVEQSRACTFLSSEQKVKDLFRKNVFLMSEPCCLSFIFSSFLSNFIFSSPYSPHIWSVFEWWHPGLTTAPGWLFVEAQLLNLFAKHESISRGQSFYMVDRQRWRISRCASESALMGKQLLQYLGQNTVSDKTHALMVLTGNETTCFTSDLHFQTCRGLVENLKHSFFNLWEVGTPF